MPISVILNGESRDLSDGASIQTMLVEISLDPVKVAVELNGVIVPKTAFAETLISDSDNLEIVHFIGGGDHPKTDDDGWNLAGHHLHSRLLVGTGKYKDFTETAVAIKASGAEIVTVAVRRVNLSDPSQPMLVDYLSPKDYIFLPNTAGCFTADDAVRTLRLAREAGGWDLVKLEVLGDQKTLYPNMAETFIAADSLVKDGFKVMVYCSDDPIAAKRLEDMGCVAIMPLGSLIGSGLGILNPTTIRLIKDSVSVPVLVDAGVGTASDAAQAMELGCDGVLMNTAIAAARDPITMAHAMRLGVEAGRLSYLAGRMPKKNYATPSSPTVGLI